MNESLIVLAFITSYIDTFYITCIWITKESIKLPPTACVVTLSNKECHITPILKEPHWLSVSHRIIHKLMQIVFKSLYGHAPTYIPKLSNTYIFTPLKIVFYFVRYRPSHKARRPLQGEGYT